MSEDKVERYTQPETVMYTRPLGSIRDVSLRHEQAIHDVQNCVLGAAKFHHLLLLVHRLCHCVGRF